MQKYILSVGHPSFPIGLAQVQRQLLIAKALKSAGFKITVLCRYGLHGPDNNLPAKGSFEGIDYEYCSGGTVRPAGYFKRNFLKVKGLINEFGYFRKLSRDGSLAGIIISTNSFYNILFYCLSGRLFRIRTVVDNVEYWTSNKDFKGFERFDKYLYDKFYFYFPHKIVCISDFLTGKISRSKGSDIIKVPAITDFEKFNNRKYSRLPGEQKYILYCGSQYYFEVIDFIVSSFDLVKEKGVILVLVTKPTKNVLERISLSKRKESVKIVTDLSYEELVGYYMNAEALLIPMRDTDQDKSRFPHKISEYCASRRPIVTNSIGEIKNYFDDSNAFLCSTFNPADYAEIIEKVLSDPGLAATIAERSYQTGLSSFNFLSYSKPLAKLFNTK